jgi:hypothetical protein
MASPFLNGFSPSLKNLEHLGLVAGRCHERGIASNSHFEIELRIQVGTG